MGLSFEHLIFKEIRVYSRLFFFFISLYLLFGCPTSNSGPLLSEDPHSPDVNWNVLLIFDPTVTRSFAKWLGP